MITIYRIRNKLSGKFLDCGAYGQYSRKNKIYYTLASARGALRAALKRLGIHSPTMEDWDKHFGHYEIVEYDLLPKRKHPCIQKDD
jgi:hypothetical protein